MKTTKLFLASAVCASMLLAGCAKNSGGGGEDKPKTYTVAVASGGNGTANTDKTTVEEGEIVTLTADPADGYAFKEWSAEGLTFSPNATARTVMFTMPARNVIVSAEFVVAEYTVTVSSGGNGEVTADKTSATKDETVKLTATADPGCEFVKWTVESGGVTCSPNETTNPATFTMPADNVSVKAEFRVKSVLINGVRWALCNVDAPGKLTAKPEEGGMFYQWNRRVGWSSVNPMVDSNGGTVWDTTIPGGELWEAENDPCPEGWAVPVKAQFDALLNKSKVTCTWVSTGVVGCKFTETSTGNSIFLPRSTGFRHNSNGGFLGSNNSGYCWGSDRNHIQDSHWLRVALLFNADVPNYSYTTATDKNTGLFVRCVAK